MLWIMKSVVILIANSCFDGLFSFFLLYVLSVFLILIPHPSPHHPLVCIAIPVILVFLPLFILLTSSAFPPAVTVSLKLKHLYVGRFRVFVVFVKASQALLHV